jgi:hypothetical protein
MNGELDKQAHVRLRVKASSMSSAMTSVWRCMMTSHGHWGSDIVQDVMDKIRLK